MNNPDVFSVRGPHGSVPWIALVDHNDTGEPSRSTMLLWATNETDALRFARGWHKSATKISVHPANPKHDLGAKSVVLDIPG